MSLISFYCSAGRESLKHESMLDCFKRTNLNPNHFFGFNLMYKAGLHGGKKQIILFFSKCNANLFEDIQYELFPI